MGHLQLGKLQATKRWQEVIALLEHGAEVADLAAATAHAAESEFESAKGDPSLGWTVWLLTQLPLAARSDQFSERLGELGFDSDAAQSLPNLVAGFTTAVDRQVSVSAERTDLGEMARLAAAESLSAVIGPGLPTLFGISPEDVKFELGKFASKDRFAGLAREFFSRLTQKALEYYLSRELPNHVRPGKTISSIDEQIAFRRALARHCHEASEIVELFAGGWFSKNNYQGKLSPAAAQGFADYALKKMRDELRARRLDDA